jgi:replicative DNA helicase
MIVEPTPRATPQNLEAEQALLGVVMFDNDALRVVKHLLAPEDFHEPFHGRLWAQMVVKADKGLLADPMTLHEALAEDPALQQLGGVWYLADLVDRAPPTRVVRDYAEQIAELSLRRRLIDLAEQASEAAHDRSLSAFEALSRARSAMEDAERTAAPDDATFVNAHESGLSLMEKVVNDVTEGRVKGIKCGLSCVDRRLGGLLPGSVVVIAGRPGMGKTALLGNIIYGAAVLNPGKLFAALSLEMDTDQLNERAFSRLTAERDVQVPYADIGKRKLSAMDLDALSVVKDMLPANLWLRDRAGASVEDVAKAVWSMKRRGDLACVGIDYLQLMRRPALAGRNEASAIAEMTGALKTLARDAKITIVLLSQLNRSVESRDDKRPQLSDLRESGSIEQDADAVLFPFREVYYLQKAEPKTGTQEHLDWEMRVHDLRRHMDVIIAKNRHGSEGAEPQDYQPEFDLIMDRRAA